MEPLRITIDTREQKPYAFERWVSKGEATLETGTLPEGDYALSGAPQLIAIERKSLDDLVNCLGKERERFERELWRLRAYPYACVVAECNYDQLILGNYWSAINRLAVIASIAAFQLRYVPIFFASNREGGELMIWQLLAKMARETYKTAAGLMPMPELKRAAR